MGVVIFDGRSSKNYGIQVERPPGYQTPARDYETVHVPGRNGDLLIDNGSYQNVSREYEIAVGSEDGDFAEMANRIAEWLHPTSGYARLEDSYEPGYYRMAAYSEGVTVENLEQHAGRAKVTFNCKPQRFLKSGDDAVEVYPRVRGLMVTFSDDTRLEEGRDYVKILYSDGERIKSLSTLSGFFGGKSVFVPNESEFFLYWHSGGGVSRYLGFEVTRVVAATGHMPKTINDSLPPLTVIETTATSGDYPKSPKEGSGQFIDMLWKYIFNVPVRVPPSIASIVTNPTGFPSLPIVKIHGSGAGSVQINGYTVGISNIRGSITIDSEVQDAYSGGENWENRNPDISLGTHGFPKLKPGLNEITFSGGITYLEVVPKWWTL